MNQKEDVLKLISFTEICIPLSTIWISVGGFKSTERIDLSSDSFQNEINFCRICTILYEVIHRFF